MADTLQGLLSQLNTGRENYADESALIADLVRQNMTQGLSVDPTTNRAGFSGPVAGYAGPLRPSDVPTPTAGADIPVYLGSVLSPSTIQARGEAGGPFRGLMPDDKAQRLARGFSGLQGMGLPDAADKEVVQGILNHLGFRTDTKGSISNDLMRSVGTDRFEGEMEKEVAKGNLDATKQIQIERLHQQRMDKTMVQDPDRRVITGTRGAVNSLQKVKDAYEATPAFKTGKVSDTLKQAMALSTSGAAIEQLAPILPKLTPEERRFIAAYNTFSLNLRGVSQDSRFSNFDSAKVLQAVGNPIVGKDLYHDQVSSALNELKARHDNIIEDLGKQGRRVGEFKRFAETDAATQNKAPQSAIDYLKAHPEAKAQFQAKYGYLP